MKKAKTNPRNRPVSEADLKKAVDHAVNEAIMSCWTIMFTVLLDKHGFTADDLQAVWNAVESLSDEITENRVSMYDLRKVLAEEYDIHVVK